MGKISRKQELSITTILRLIGRRQLWHAAQTMSDWIGVAACFMLAIEKAMAETGVVDMTAPMPECGTVAEAAGELCRAGVLSERETAMLLAADDYVDRVVKREIRPEAETLERYAHAVQALIERMDASWGAGL